MHRFGQRRAVPHSVPGRLEARGFAYATRTSGRNAGVTPPLVKVQDERLVFEAVGIVAQLFFGAHHARDHLQRILFFLGLLLFGLLVSLFPQVLELLCVQTHDF